MAEADAARWDVRHGAATPPTPVPPDALVRHGLVDLVPGSGRALDVACGTGAVTVWLATRGLEVVAVDVSTTGVARLHELAAEHGVASRVTPIVHDLDDGLPMLGAAPVAPEAPFDVVICQRFRDRRVHREVLGRIVPGGLGVITVLSAVGAAAPGPFHAPAGELIDTVASSADVEVLAADEGAGEASVVVRRRVQAVAF